VLSHTKPEINATGEQAGKPNKAKFILDAKAEQEAKSRIKALLDRFPVYPQLDLAFMESHFA